MASSQIGYFCSENGTDAVLTRGKQCDDCGRNDRRKRRDLRTSAARTAACRGRKNPFNFFQIRRENAFPRNREIGRRGEETRGFLLPRRGYFLPFGERIVSY